VYDDAGGAALYAGGASSVAGGKAANRIARWNGSSWSALGSGVSSNPGSAVAVHALTVYDDGGGAALYVAGRFTIAGGVAALNIAKWDGSSWSPLGSGLGTGFGDVLALAVYDDGGGAALYAGGNFDMAGGVAAIGVARWDGSSWTPLGSGLGGQFDNAHSMTVYDDGGGAALYAGGNFVTAGGVAANHIAKWDGSSWSPLGGGMNNFVNALAAHDDGSGAALFAGGAFSSAIDSGDSYLAKWGCVAPAERGPTLTDARPLPQPGAGGIRK